VYKSIRIDWRSGRLRRNRSFQKMDIFAIIRGLRSFRCGERTLLMGIVCVQEGEPPRWRVKSTVPVTVLTLTQ
jgi:hypothetical protein